MWDEKVIIIRSKEDLNECGKKYEFKYSCGVMDSDVEGSHIRNKSECTQMMKPILKKTSLSLEVSSGKERKMLSR